MIATLAAATFAVFALTARTDTTFSIGPEARLEIENFAGDVTVGTWGKNAVRIEADHSSRASVDIERDGSTVTVKAEGRHGVPTSVDFRITVPASAALKISGVYTDVTITGVKADLAVETVRGDVNVTGGAGHIVLQSVEGDVNLEGGHGRAELSSVNSGVTVRDHDGELALETVNGEITLEDIRCETVEASTVNGDVLFDGEVKSGGRYSFATHNGNITVGLPGEPNVSVSVATYSGDFESDFPVKRASARHNKRFRFTLGSGSAELELESFQGSIRLVRGDASGMGKAKEKVVERKKETEKMKHEAHEKTREP